MQLPPELSRVRAERRIQAAFRLATRRRTPPSVRVVGLVLGPVLFGLVMVLPRAEGLSADGRTTAAVAVWMAVWWVSRAIPLAATALLPLLLFPALGVTDATSTASSYVSGVIFLFLGGFVLAAGVQRWGLHRRLAHAVVPRTPQPAAQVLLSFMAVTAFLSMWMSNTAAAMVMLPVAAEVIPKPETSRLAARASTAFMLGVAYSASVGGIATLIGSPPNAVFAGYAREVLGEPVTFLRWMAWGLPVAVVGLAVTWLFLSRVAYRELRVLRIGRGDEDLSRRSPGVEERRVLVVFGGVVALWLGRGLIGPLAAHLTDEGVALAGAALLLLLPARGIRGARLLHPRDLRRLPWGILVLFGGGIALAGAIESSGLAGWIGGRVTLLDALPAIVVLLALVLVTIFLTELASNTATAAVLIPIAHGAATVAGLVPLEVTVAVTVAASCAFMLPVATPPNAVVFASGRVTLGQMLRAGLVLNVLLAVVVATAVRTWLPLAWPG
ncbi:MAG: SLC13 family permease [Dehalococcoidia bacterium]|nr:SLC13 family permease [Dehalococcoidia bacterium]